MTHSSTGLLDELEADLVADLHTASSAIFDLNSCHAGHLGSPPPCAIETSPIFASILSITATAACAARIAPFASFPFPNARAALEIASASMRKLPCTTFSPSFTPSTPRRNLTRGGRAYLAAARTTPLRADSTICRMPVSKRRIRDGKTLTGRSPCQAEFRTCRFEQARVGKRMRHRPVRVSAEPWDKQRATCRRTPFQDSVTLISRFGVMPPFCSKRRRAPQRGQSAMRYSFSPHESASPAPRASRSDRPRRSET